MKKALFLFALLAALPSFAAEDIFDGLYIKTKAGKNIELQVEPAYQVHFGPKENRARDALALSRRDKTYYVVETKNTLDVNLSDFKGFVFQGKHFEFLSMHKLNSREYREGDQMYRNTFDGIDWGMVMHTPGERIEIRKKTHPETRQVYIEPKQNVTKGRYVLWAGQEFWLVRFL